MCVIMYKTAKAKISEDTLRLAWQTNPHGAGLAYFTHDNRVQIIKGIMSIERLIQAIDCLQNIELVLHFRLATHGLKNRHQTHPFTVSREIKEAKAMSFDGIYDNAFFHNGVIYNCGSEKISDTLDFTSRILANIPKTSTRLSVLNVMGDSFAYMAKGKTWLIGPFKTYKGLECSNTYFDRTTLKQIAYPGSWEHDLEHMTDRERADFGLQMNDYFNSLDTKTIRTK